MFQPAPGKQYIEPQITIDGKTPQAVESFTYLGSTLSRTAAIDTEVNKRISRQVSHSEDCGRKYGGGDESALRPN